MVWSEHVENYPSKIRIKLMNTCVACASCKIHMTHAADHELNTRAFAPFAPYHSLQLEEQRNARNVPTFCSKLALRFKKVPLTTDVKISLRARFCSPAIKLMNTGYLRVFALFYFVTLDDVYISSSR